MANFFVPHVKKSKNSSIATKTVFQNTAIKAFSTFQTGNYFQFHFPPVLSRRLPIGFSD
jgi:hypothetical protein